MAWQENRSSSGVLPTLAGRRQQRRPPRDGRGGIRAPVRGWVEPLLSRLRHPLEPCLLPIDEAARLAAAVRLAVAAHPLQVDGVAHAVHTCRADRVAQLHRQLVHPKPPAAELQHLRHEGQRLQLTSGIEGGQDVRLAAHLDDLADAQVDVLACGYFLGLHCITPV